MNKIQWTTEELKSFGGNTYIICSICGWFVNEPPEDADECCNCGKSYKQTNSKIQRRR